MLYKPSEQFIEDDQGIEKIAKTIKKRFITYGFKRVYTSAFEKYDLYTEVKSSINQAEMIKVIDHLNQVLVLRPDVTLPITRQLAKEYTALPNDLRYYYIQDVYRKPVNALEKIESTQAGVEFFSESSPEADAEVIALAIHMLKDLGFQSVKMELGHAGFFNELMNELALESEAAEHLKQLIRAKNIAEIGPFLETFSVDTAVKNAVKQIPFLYGNPLDVCKDAEKIAFTPKMQEKINYFRQLSCLLEMYGVSEHVVMDLGLINHMGYYSDVIFQGFVENIGLPALMGGRYNELGHLFAAHLPAIGFACKLETLMLAMEQAPLKRRNLDAIIVYDQLNKAKAIRLVTKLRLENYRLLITPDNKLAKLENQAKCKFIFERDAYFLEIDRKRKAVASEQDLLDWLRR